MGTDCISPSLPRSRLQKWGCLSGRQKQRQDTKLFLDEYPRWKIEAPHWSIILHEMFLHTTEQGQKEVERFIQWGHQQTLPRPDPEADLPTMKLVGYWTSHKEIRDLYHSVYLLRRLPGPLPCRPQLRKEAIQDILSSLRNCLHRWVLGWGWGMPNIPTPIVAAVANHRVNLWIDVQGSQVRIDRRGE